MEIGDSLLRGVCDYFKIHGESDFGQYHPVDLDGCEQANGLSARGRFASDRADWALANNAHIGQHRGATVFNGGKKPGFMGPYPLPSSRRCR